MGLPTESKFSTRSNDAACYIPQRGDAMQESPTRWNRLNRPLKANRTRDAGRDARLFGLERFYELERVSP